MHLRFHEIFFLPSMKMRLPQLIENEQFVIFFLTLHIKTTYVPFGSLTYVHMYRLANVKYVAY